jgi:hypothetical protein
LVKATPSPVSLQEPGPLTRSIAAADLNLRARYVKMRGVNIGTIPAGHPAAGAKAWLFVDELMVNPDGAK